MLSLSVQVPDAEDANDHLKEASIHRVVGCKVVRELTRDIEYVFGNLELLDLLCVDLVDGFRGGSVSRLL